jgi:hypothetical protein
LLGDHTRLVVLGRPHATFCGGRRDLYEVRFNAEHGSPSGDVVG